MAACDLLVPVVGELAGGSQREERYDVLQRKCKNWQRQRTRWYLDTRRYGAVNTLALVSVSIVVDVCYRYAKYS